MLSEFLGAFAATLLTIAFGLWIGLTWQSREYARRTLLNMPVIADVELAYEPFVFSMFRVLPQLYRTPRPALRCAVAALLTVLGGRPPMWWVSDEELAEIDRKAWEDAVRRHFGEDDR